MRLTRSGGLVLAAAFGLLASGAAVDYPELVVFGACAFVQLVLAALWVLAKPKIRVERVLRPVRVTEGKPITCQLTVVNQGGHAVPGFELTDMVEGQPVRRQVSGLPVGTPILVYEYPLPTYQRGVHHLPPLSVDRLDPARLLRRGFTTGRRVTYYVHPRYHSLSAFGESRLRDVDGQASQPRLDGVAFYSLRPYVPGDDRRLIHWPSTARAGTLIVRQNSTPDAPGYLVVLDTAAQRYTDASFEEAVRVAASLCVAAVRVGARLRLRTTGRDRTRCEVDDPLYSVTPVLDFLAGVRTEPASAAWPSVLTPAGDILGVTVVTGRLPRRELGALSGGVTDPRTLAIVQLDQRAPSIASPHPGVLMLNVRTSAEFAERWNGQR